MKNSSRSAGLRRLFKKFPNTVFLLLVGHLAFCELTNRITTWMFYAIFLHNLHKLDSPVPAGQEGNCPILVRV
jgi:hypothetical protein